MATVFINRSKTWWVAERIAFKDPNQAKKKKGSNATFNSTRPVEKNSMRKN
jgi:hypothetical protein